MDASKVGFYMSNIGALGRCVSSECLYDINASFTATVAHNRAVKMKATTFSRCMTVMKHLPLPGTFVKYF